MNEMLVTLKGFGSIWETRFGKDKEDPMRFASATFFNTTGIEVNGKLRHRWKIGGKIRMGVRGGFDPNHPAKALNRVFEMDEPKMQTTGWTQAFVRRRLPAPVRPEAFLFAVTSEQTGRLDWRGNTWRAENVQVISFSEDRGQQQTLLLMPAFAWVRGELGTFFVEPSQKQFWSADLRLGRAA